MVNFISKMKTGARKHNAIFHLDRTQDHEIHIWKCVTERVFLCQTSDNTDVFGDDEKDVAMRMMGAGGGEGGDAWSSPLGPPP